MVWVPLETMRRRRAWCGSVGRPAVLQGAVPQVGVMWQVGMMWVVVEVVVVVVRVRAGAELEGGVRAVEPGPRPRLRIRSST